MKNSLVIGGTYQQYKTKKFYRVLAVAKHSETDEDLIIYECLYTNPESNIWARPKQMFLEEVIDKGNPTFRFELIEKP